MKLKNFTNDHRLNNRRRNMAETLPIQRKTQCNQSMYLYAYIRSQTTSRKISLRNIV